MKHKKVLALLISAGLTASSLHGCSLMPQTAFGMETGEQKAAGEDMTDGTEENAQDPALSGEQQEAGKAPAAQGAPDGELTDESTETSDPAAGGADP